MNAFQGNYRFIFFFLAKNYVASGGVVASTGENLETAFAFYHRLGISAAETEQNKLSHRFISRFFQTRSSPFFFGNVIISHKM